MKMGTSQVYNFERKRMVSLCMASPLMSPGLGSLVNLIPPQAGSPKEEEVPLLFFPTLENNNPLQPFHSSALSAKQQNWKLMNPVVGGAN